MKTKPLFYISLLAVLFTASCKKHEAAEEHIPVASIVINNPLPGAVYHSGDSVTIQAMAMSTESLHGYDVYITKANDTTTYFFEHIHDHNNTVMINRKWKATVAAPANLEANITIYLDHALHTTKKKVAFSIQ